MSDSKSIDQACINAIRFLSADAVQKANSGHPGAPMGAAAAAYSLWDHFLKHNPDNPGWADRDRFILSAGHASMLLYSLLHLTGYELPIEEIEHFRQWESMTPGHPEFGLTPGVECTAGPLGQGFANGVGMAIAERWLAARFNRPGHEIVNHHTYALVSDGDLQEGVSAEAASLAGTLGLSKLIYLYDDNGIQIEGSTNLAFTENVGERFLAYGWQVIGPVDGNDPDKVAEAIEKAKAETLRPSLILCRTIIGFGSPKAGSSKAHGEPLGEENLLAAKKTLGWPETPSFLVPDEVRAHMRKALDRGREAEAAWWEKFEAYTRAYPQEAGLLTSYLENKAAAGFEEAIEDLYPAGSKPEATRNASGKALNAIAARVGNLMGGSADLAPSNKTMLAGEEAFSETTPAGRNMHFGVREHAMGSIALGMSLHGGILPYTGTFLVFSDYMRPPMRLAALSKKQVVYVFSHDSIGVGEDGPTHQPVEHLMSMRAVPNLTVLRPGDANETAQAWVAALKKTDGPSCIVTTRQNLPVFDRAECGPAEGTLRGGYILWQADPGRIDAILIASGSEASLALDAAKALSKEGVQARVVSMPSFELFDAQPESYRNEVLPPAIRARVSAEAGITFGWQKYVGLDGASLGLDHYGASAPAGTLFKEFGFTVENLCALVKAVIAKN